MQTDTSLHGNRRAAKQLQTADFPLRLSASVPVCELTDRPANQFDEQIPDDFSDGVHSTSS